MPLNLNMPTQWRVGIAYAPKNITAPDHTVEVNYAPIDRWWTDFVEGHTRLHLQHADGTEIVWQMEVVRRFLCERV